VRASCNLRRGQLLLGERDVSGNSSTNGTLVTHW
jgi:hypothetical protein